MQITDILAQMGGLQSMARELGVSETQAASGAEALIPAILGGFKKQAQSQPAGLEGLGGLLGQLGGGGLLDDVLAPQPTDVSRGNDVLGQIFGSKDVSRAVAQNAASQSGLDPSLLKKMLPMLAMLVAGYMAKQGGAGAAHSNSPGGRRARRWARWPAGRPARRSGRHARRRRAGARLDARPERRRQSAGRHPADGRNLPKDVAPAATYAQPSSPENVPGIRRGRRWLGALRSSGGDDGRRLGLDRRVGAGALPD